MSPPESNPPPANPPNDQPSVLDLLLGDAEEDTPQDPANNKDPQRKYTDAIMPTVQTFRPLSHFDHMDVDIVERWWKLPGSKLLAIPFDGDVNNQKLHDEIKGRILAAVADVTSSTTAIVIAPQPSEEAVRTGQIPKSFLIYNISESHCQMLLQRRVWASINFTFQAVPLEPTCPDFLFTIQGFTALENGAILDTVWEIWKDEITQEFIQSLIEEAPPASRDALQLTLVEFVNSMWVGRLNIKTKGNCLRPEFNVYAKGALIRDTSLWPKLRRFFAKRTYHHQGLGRGRTVTAPHNCGICHGRDHPRGLCPFPGIDGWFGPKRWPEPRFPKGGRQRKVHPRSSYP